jgi:hypothetical protein
MVFCVITRGFSLHRVPAIGFVGGIPVGLQFFGDFGFFGFGFFVFGRLWVPRWTLPRRRRDPRLGGQPLRDH